ncbi:MAG TPA: ATP-binding protein, partial [Streptomyces sp.]
MSSFSPGADPSRRLPPRPESVRSARQFVRAAANGAAPGMVATAELLVSELVTNAVVHAHTDIEVRVSFRDGRIRIQVTDAYSYRGLMSRRPFPYASTGWGLPIVEQLAARYGVRSAGERKTVWCELWPGGPPPSASSPASEWTPAAPAVEPTTALTLLDMPRVLYLASQHQRAALLHELVLAVNAGQGFGVTPEELFTAQDMNSAISARLTAALADQPSEADMHSLYVRLPADSTEAVLSLHQLLERADEAARHGRLLTLPALPQVRAFRHWLFDQIINQLAGGHAAAWTLVPREPSARPSELAAWDADQVRTSRVPTIAANQENRIIAVNGPTANMLGWHVEDLVGQRITMLIPEHLRRRHLEAFASLLLTGVPRILGRSVPLPALHRDGSTVPVRLFIQTQEATDGRTVFVAQLIPRSTETASASRTEGRSSAAAPADTGEPRRPAAVGTARATGGAATVLERLSLLADITSQLTSAPDLDEALQRTGRVLTQQLAEWCVVDLLEADHVNRACVVHRDPEVLPPGGYEGRLPPVSDGRGSLARVLSGAAPLLLTGIPSQARADSPLDARQQELFDRLEADSAIIAPLRVRRDILGALTVVRTPGEPPFTQEDLPLIADVVRAIALGVDSIRLHQETRHIAENLQRSLLPELPRVGHLEIAARYAPSSATA